jgi:hypothetical protein
VPGAELPADFALIPEDAPLGTVLYAVPGTAVAKDAVADASLPQTAAVKRDATLSVEYDGEPRFEPVTGTTLSYAVNTATPVVLAEGSYYACDDAIWFVAEQPAGGWRVATSVPGVIYSIPPESPLYNVTFVRVYDATPEVVYVGYTPGYTQTYVYHTTIVYGTGYPYPGWYGRYYYPGPATWGFHVRWNPWTGWRFGLSYGTGPFHFHIGVGGWYRGGWWGPARYHGYRRGYRHGYRRGVRAGYRAGRRSAARQNLYRSERNQARTRPAKTSARPSAGAAAGRANDVFADRNGDVHRKTDKGWESRTRDGWKEDAARGDRAGDARTREAGAERDRSTAKKSQQRDLDRSQQARQRGEQRSRSYDKSRSRGGGGRSGGRGGGRGGGRR